MINNIVIILVTLWSIIKHLIRHLLQFSLLIIEKEGILWNLYTYIVYIHILRHFIKIYIFNTSKYDEDSPPHIHPSIKNKCEEPSYSNQSQFNGFHTAKTELAS